MHVDLAIIFPYYYLCPSTFSSTFAGGAPEALGAPRLTHTGLHDIVLDRTRGDTPSPGQLGFAVQGS